MPEASTTTARERADGGRLVSGFVWNALGRGLPLLLALLITPFLVKLLGVERWGLFTLALALVGIFGIFDLGLGMALTRAVSEKLGANHPDEAKAMIGAALIALFGISAVVAIALLLLMPWLVSHVLNVPAALQAEAVTAFQVLAAAAPLVVLNASLWGILSAWQRFRQANLVNIPLNAFYYLGPVLILLVWDSLIAVMITLVFIRLLSGICYALIAQRDVPGLGLRQASFASLRPLFRQGLWMSFSGALTQLLLYADRFVIGAVLTLSAVAFYATPLDLVMRMWILPVAVAQTLLPAIASSYRSLENETALLVKRGALIIMGLALPACAILIPSAASLLRLWLGEEFASGGGAVLRLLACGIFFSCLAFIPGVLLEAIGRPDVIAKFSLVQMMIFLPLSAALLPILGIEGAALAWVCRCLVDVLGRAWLAIRLYPPSAKAVRDVALPFALAAIGLFLLLAVQDILSSLVIASILCCLVLLTGWRAAAPEDRHRLLARIVPKKGLRT